MELKEQKVINFSIELLPGALILKDSVKGDENCGYEQYLFEFINKSNYFKEKSNNKPYFRPVDESNGECDCISENYELDFKLIVASTLLHAKKELSLQSHKISNTLIITSAPRRSGEMQCVQLHEALRLYSLEQLEIILQQQYKYGTIKRDMQTYLKTLKVEKNLLLFFPFFFSTCESYDFDLVIENIIKVLNNDFRESIRFRNKYCATYDTYFCFIYNDKLIILEFKKGDYMEKIEIMKLSNSKTFIDLYHKYGYLTM